jgi:hypothetical protein
MLKKKLMFDFIIIIVNRNRKNIYRFMEFFYAAHHTTGKETSPAPEDKQTLQKAQNCEYLREFS